MKKKELVFAFGSNMHLRQMYARCPSTALLGPGVVKNFRIGFGGESRRWNGAVATIVQAPGKRCYGLLFEVTEADLERLDQFEGVPHVYERITVPVHRGSPAESARWSLADGGRVPSKPKRAHVYRLRTQEPGFPSSEYLGLIWKEYREWGFDASGLAEALEEGCRGKDHLRQAHALAERMILTAKTKESGTC